MVNAHHEAGKDYTYIAYEDDLHGSHKEDLEFYRSWLNGEDANQLFNE